jgi:signal transduction histidine kinase
VRADRRALHQCLLNLLSNAVKFTPAGSALEVALTGTETGQVVFSVRDKGPGVPPPVLERLGEPFVAQDDPQHTKEPGSGLGLAITRSLMERMSGELAVANVTGGGAEARLTLPRD